MLVKPPERDLRLEKLLSRSGVSLEWLKCRSGVVQVSLLCGLTKTGTKQLCAFYFSINFR